nr:MAG TPA: hypothetical protein [Caudoviricetes sp.]
MGRLTSFIKTEQSRQSISYTLRKQRGGRESALP